jgi:sortase (surface protein transpeptidase)
MRIALRVLATILAVLGATLVASDLVAISTQLGAQRAMLQHWTQVQGAWAAPAAPTAVEFLVRVPKLGYQAVVRDGVSTAFFHYGPGHYPGTPMPGSPGNVGIAAYDTHWIAWPRLTAGDQLEIHTRSGTYLYRIDSRRLISAADRTPLSQDTAAHRLTMTTNWPLWPGALAAPRLVFVATEIGGVA